MKIKEVIIVEGKYDKIAVESAVDATVIETKGFGIFSDRERLKLIKEIAEKRGIIILTDSDGAGLVIRNYLKGAVKDKVKQAYVPGIKGKERRKKSPSKEHLLGVEGMDRNIILNALLSAGATTDDGDGTRENKNPITKGDLYELGLSGKEGSAEKRRTLLKKLGLPENLSSNAMLDYINILYSREDIYRFL